MFSTCYFHYELIQNTYDIFENQFNVLKLSLDMLNIDGTYSIRFYIQENYNK